jgi:GNAT superfamily N-acetyltransferase
MVSFDMETSISGNLDKDLSIITADRSHIDMLVAVRVEFALDMHPVSDRSEILELERLTRQYILRGMRDGSYVGFLGLLNGQTVGAASLLIYTLPPLIGRHDRRQGHVLNVYTAPHLRGRGIGRRMMETVIAEGRKRGLFRLFLNSTKMGEPLYRSLAFIQQEEKAMVLPLC